MKIICKSKGVYDYPYTEYIGNKGKLKFKAKIFEDGSGEYTVHYGKNPILAREDGNFKMWNKDLEFEMKINQALDDFFLEIDKDIDFRKHA